MDYFNLGNEYGIPFFIAKKCQLNNDRCLISLDQTDFIYERKCIEQLLCADLYYKFVKNVKLVSAHKEHILWFISLHSFLFPNLK